MKFINYIEKVSGVDMLGLLSLVVFFLFFTAMLTWVYKTKKKDFIDVSRLPLDNSHPSNL
jgi:cbb3-type cytochrome oxidase subunit 3